jgi:hypothetical protein
MELAILAFQEERICMPVHAYRQQGPTAKCSENVIEMYSRAWLTASKAYTGVQGTTGAS